MHGMRNRKGVRHDDLRTRLRELGRKARRDPKALTLAELEEICTLAQQLKPDHDTQVPDP